MHLKSNHTFDKNCHCDSIKGFLANSYFILQIYHAKSFKMKYIRSLSLNFFIKIFIKTLKSVVRFKMHKTLIQHSLNANISLLRGVHLFDRSMAQLTTLIFFQLILTQIGKFHPKLINFKEQFYFSISQELVPDLYSMHRNEHPFEKKPVTLT